jgi:hypothetical protein
MDEEEKKLQEAIENDRVKQRRYQANFNKRHRAARKRLGLTIAAFNKLPKATRMLEMKHPGSVSAKAKRNRERQHAWYLRRKAAKATNSEAKKEAPTPSNSESNKDRIISFCRDLLAFAETLK